MKTYELFYHNKWRPSIGWIHCVVVLFDFVLAPVGYSTIQFLSGAPTFEQWSPLTLQGGGLYHVSMLTIVGVTAYGRSKEKLQQVASDLTVSDITKKDL